MSDTAPYVHPLGVCESDSVGAGTRIWAFAHVLPGAVIGDNCNVCDHAYIEYGVRLGNRVTVKNGVQLFEGVTVGDDVFLGPNCIFTNDFVPRAAVKKGADELLGTTVASGVSIGANATIVCGVTLNEGAMIGAGAVVTKDVQSYSLVVGNPARHLRWVCACGGEPDGSGECSCGRRYDHTESGLVLRQE